ncbi:MarR family transcriptional regulator [Seongchinamella unica]|uniref:MarR family transcriptional regulator n=1 Tax=Seongchinamella unica TaxID=2547392 RepID=A0A4R5LQG4_9GAMM|nr:MarR family transcriptional regulator [Seongchinamella unica]TDG12824.1 MarR family transcriptional regulator [Seongchinamella unica]
MEQLPLWHEVLVELRRIIRATDLQSRRVVKACGLTIPQVMVLRAIADLGDVTVRRLADHVSLSQATVTTILNRLESRDLVIRVRSASDKRVVNARLTDAGRDILASAPTLLHEKFIERFNGLAEGDQSSILAAIRSVAEMMDAEKIDASPLLDVNQPG